MASLLDKFPVKLKTGKLSSGGLNFPGYKKGKRRAAPKVSTGEKIGRAIGKKVREVVVKKAKGAAQKYFPRASKIFGAGAKPGKVEKTRGAGVPVDGDRLEKRMHNAASFMGKHGLGVRKTLTAQQRSQRAAQMAHARASRWE